MFWACVQNVIPNRTLYQDKGALHPDCSIVCWEMPLLSTWTCTEMGICSDFFSFRKNDRTEHTNDEAFLNISPNETTPYKKC
jgi:hypothetical protein